MADVVVAFTEWLAERLGITMAVEPFGLWAHAIEETQGGANVTDPVTVVRAYPGGTPSAVVPIGHELLQAFTRGSTSAKAMQRAYQIDAALCAEDGLPCITVTVAGFVFTAICNIRSPGLVGRDDQQRAEVAQNFELFYTRT